MIRRALLILATLLIASGALSGCLARTGHSLAEAPSIAEAAGTGAAVGGALGGPAGAAIGAAAAAVGAWLLRRREKPRAERRAIEQHRAEQGLPTLPPLDSVRRGD